MKFTLSWLKEHLATDAPLAQIAETLTRIGLEVEAIHDPAEALRGFTVARVVEAKPHPNADKLRVCLVDTGDGGAPVQVVCGAPNARTGMTSVFSPPGTFIPGKNITLGVGTIRGVESRGMLVSAAELKLSDDHEGIIDLPADAPVGVPYADYLGLEDPVVEINLTPNRPDCTAVSGVARDLAAAGLGELTTKAPAPVRGAYPCPVPVTLDLPADKAHWCPAFALRLVRGVRNGPSPDWLQRRLTAIGLRPINALVDITNFVTFDRGRPLHVFDAKKVKGGLVVRPGREGEAVLALDGRSYALDARVCVIADDNGVESIAGIMGGEHSGCDEGTTDVLIESALWDPSNIAATGRRLGIHTDARYRFERGVDPDFTVPGVELATRLVMELCGGSPSEVLLAGAIPDTGRAIDFPTSEVKRLTGLDVSQAEVKLALQALGFWVSGQGSTWKVAPPSWRPDIEGKADLVEEVMRLVGVDRIPATPLPRGDTVMGPVLTTAQKRTRAAKRALAARGLDEAVTWSFIAKAEARRFGGGDDAMDLANPISVEMSTLRPSLLPGLVAAAQRNADRGLPDVALFEVGQVFHGPEPGEQTMNAAGLRRAQAKPAGAGRHWSASAAPVDAFDAKADALAALAAAGAPVEALQIGPGAPAWFHPGRSGVVRLGPNVIGAFGELHPAVVEAMGASGPLAGFELVLDKIPQPKAKTRAKGRLDASALLPVRRDFAFVVDAGVAAGDIVRAAKGADKQLIERVGVFDVYQGDRLPAGKKSVAIEVVLQPRERTMTDAEIEAVAAKVVAQVTKATGAALRT
jgi:phenylalanyl-tRNA synthetase beta chain